LDNKVRDIIEARCNCEDRVVWNLQKIYWTEFSSSSRYKNWRFFLRYLGKYIPDYRASHPS